MRKHHLLAPYCRALSRASWWSCGGGCFFMIEVPLYSEPHTHHQDFPGVSRAAHRGTPRPLQIPQDLVLRVEFQSRLAVCSTLNVSRG